MYRLSSNLTGEFTFKCNGRYTSPKSTLYDTCTKRNVLETLIQNDRDVARLM